MAIERLAGMVRSRCRTATKDEVAPGSRRPLGARVPRTGPDAGKSLKVCMAKLIVLRHVRSKGELATPMFKRVESSVVPVVGNEIDDIHRINGCNRETNRIWRGQIKFHR